MRIDALVAAVALIGVGYSTTAIAANFSGQWEASGPAQAGRRCPAYDAHITVRGNNVVIRLGGAAQNYLLRGSVAPDGSFTAEGVNGESSARGKFSGDTVEMSLTTFNCVRPGTGKRAG